MLASPSSEEESSDPERYDTSYFGSSNSESGLINLTTVGPRLAGSFDVIKASIGVDIPSESLIETDAGEVLELDCCA